MAIRKQRIREEGGLLGDTALIAPQSTTLTPGPNPVPYLPAELSGKLAPPQKPAREPEGPGGLIQQFMKKLGEGDDILTRLKSAYEERPERGDYGPSKGRRVAAGAVGGLTGLTEGPQAGISAARGVIDRPYQDAYQDWVSRTGALERQTGLELQGQDIANRGFADILEYQESLDQYDPVIQGTLVKALGKAGEDVVGQRQEFDREQLELELESRGDIAEANRKSAAAINDALIAGREARGEAYNATLLGIAQARADLGTVGGIVSPENQYKAKVMAGNIVAGLLPDIENKEALFTEVLVEDGPSIWMLKEATEIDTEFYDVYQKMMDQIGEVTDQIISGRGYNDPIFDIQRVPK
jgi:hypothetical protein